MPAFPARTGLVDAYPNPSVDTYKNAIGALWDAVTGLLGTDGQAATALAALGAAPLSNPSFTDITVTGVYNNLKITGTAGGMGGANLIIGGNSISDTINGIENTAIGINSLRYITSGWRNTALGYNALNQNTTGSYNESIGVGSLVSNTTGDSNVALGTLALSGNTTGNSNIAIGMWALSSLTSGNQNIVIGRNAGDGITTGSGNTIIGYSTPALYSNLTNNIILASGNAIRAQFDGSSWSFNGNIVGGDYTLSSTFLKDQGFVYYNSGTTNALDYSNGSHQRWAPTGTVTLSITNWPPGNNLGELLIEGVNLGAATITWPTINWIKSDGTTTTTFSSNGITLQSSGTDWIFLWTRDAGTTIYGKVVR